MSIAHPFPACKARGEQETPQHQGKKPAELIRFLQLLLTLLHPSGRRVPALPTVPGTWHQVFTCNSLGTLWRLWQLSAHRAGLEGWPSCSLWPWGVYGIELCSLLWSSARLKMCKNPQQASFVHLSVLKQAIGKATGAS